MADDENIHSFTDAKAKAEAKEQEKLTALLLRRTADGGFVVGDPVSGITAYTPPTSQWAKEAEQSPRQTAVEMLAFEVGHRQERADDEWRHGGEGEFTAPEDQGRLHFLNQGRSEADNQASLFKVTASELKAGNDRWMARGGKRQPPDEPEDLAAVRWDAERHVRLDDPGYAQTTGARAMANNENDSKPSTYLRDDLKENHEVNTGFRLHEEGLSNAAIYEHLDKAYDRPAMRAMGALDAGRVDPFEQRSAVTEAANMESRNAIPEAGPFDHHGNDLSELQPIDGGGAFQRLAEQGREVDAGRVTITEAGRQHLAELEALKSDPHALLYRLDPDGGFTVGQRESGLASYAYPTSESASHAKGDPATVARDMFEREWRDRDLRAEGAPAADTIREKDARLMETLGYGLADGSTEAAPRDPRINPEIDAQLERLAQPFDGYPNRDTSHNDGPLPNLDTVKVEGFAQEVRAEKREANRQEIASLREAMGGPPPERDETPSLPGVMRKEPEQLALASAVREKPASREFDRW